MIRHSIRHYLSGLLLTAFLCISCSQEDDIDSIFREGVWYMTNVYVSPGKSALTQDELRSVVQAGRNGFYIQFSGNNFSGKSKEKEFSGSWRVTSDRKMFITFQNTGNPTDQTSKTMIEILQQAERYAGDTNYLNIYQAESGRFIAFTRNKP